MHNSLPKLYGSVVSPFVRKVLVSLFIKNIEHTIEPLIPFIPEHKALLFQMNPLGTIPIYQEEDLIPSDSSVICAYLDKKYPRPVIYPSDAKSYAQCLWYEEYADTCLIPSILPVFFNVCLATRFHREPDMNAVQNALDNKLPLIFSYLDREIGDKKYLVGDQLSIADIAISAGFLNFEFAKHTVDAKQWKNLARYIENISHESTIEKSFSLARERFFAK